MSEELLHEQTQTEAAVTMADLEEHFDDANPWNVVKSYMEKGTILPVKVEGIVNGGAIAMIEGIRGFIPASRLSLSYIDIMVLCYTEINTGEHVICMFLLLLRRELLHYERRIITRTNTDRSSCYNG